jgi:hypothetical protein
MECAEKRVRRSSLPPGANRWVIEGKMGRSRAVVPTVTRPDILINTASEVFALLGGKPSDPSRSGGP